MTDKPTKQQRQTFGVSYDILYQALIGSVHAISEDSFIQARNIVRAFVDVRSVVFVMYGCISLYYSQVCSL